MKHEFMTVSEVNKHLKRIIDLSANLKGVYVKGEISNFTYHSKSGHVYFTLKDSTSSIKVVMFKSYADKVKVDLEDGMRVIIYGNITVYERDGVCQIYCESVKLDGEGELYAAYEKLKLSLFQRGYFDDTHKKALPIFPKKICVITSEDGAAFRDIVNIVSRRYPVSNIVLIPSLVQGLGAVESLCRCIRIAREMPDIDVIILGRGGGSIEDLWAFNSESLAEEIFNCNIPIVSAVGHETDFTIADFVSDFRAPTPSAAAEVVTPDKNELLRNIESAFGQLRRIIFSKFDTKEYLLNNFKVRLNKVSPKSILERQESYLQFAKDKLSNTFFSLYNQKLIYFKNCVDLLNNLSPLNIISRGYTVTLSGSRILKSVGDVKDGQVIKTKFVDGEIFSFVNNNVGDDTNERD